MGGCSTGLPPVPTYLWGGLLVTLVISAISVVIGLTLANTIRPGERLDPETRAGLEARYGGA